VNYTIPANTLKAGTVVQVRYAGFGVTGIGTDTFAHKLYIGGSAGTALLTSTAAQLPPTPRSAARRKSSAARLVLREPSRLWHL
jgi:hypothetical protein